MSVTASALREIHRIHRQISDLRSSLERGPRQIRAAEAHLQTLQGSSVAVRDSLKQARMSADSKQLQLRQREDHIKDIERKLNSCGSNREYQTLKEQMAADEQANSVLSDEILETLEKIDELERMLAQQEEQQKKAEAELAAVRERVEEQQARLEAELNRVTSQLHQVETSLPPEIKSDYERIARARGEDALAQVDNETCGGCFQRLSPQTMNLLIMGKATFCSSCGSLLYLPEDTSPTS